MGTMKHIHVALFKWKDGVTTGRVNAALGEVRALSSKVPGIDGIYCGANQSKWAAGYTHAVLVIGESAEAIAAYRNHPDHMKVAAEIDAMEERGIGVDFSDG